MENCLQWNDKNEKGFLIIGLDGYIASYLSNTIGLRNDHWQNHQVQTCRKKSTNYLLVKWPKWERFLI
jgi:hypothetical protein